MTDDATADIEAALVAYWSHMGRWPRGAVVDERGCLRYETPIPHLPYNGVVRTHADPDAVAAVAATFRERGVDYVWWVHPTSTPDDLGARLEAEGLQLVERVHGMALELDGWTGAPPLPGVEYVEVLDEEALAAYADLIVAYWQLPEESRELVAELNAHWAPGRAPVHRWIARLDGRVVGKGLVLVGAPDGVASIYGMSVLPEARGRGVAGGLTTALVHRAQELGCRRVVLHSTAMAAGVYRRAGFVDRCPLTVYAPAAIWSHD